MDIILEPKKTARILTMSALCITLVHVMLEFIHFVYGHGYVFGLNPLFDFDNERNIPTMYSTLLLLFASTLLAITAFATIKTREAFSLHWAGLGFIFLFLALDEAFEIHERLIEPIRANFHTSGIFYFGWVIPYGILLGVFIIVYLKFLTHLPRKTMFLFVFSGFLYVSGAMGFELIGGKHYELFGDGNSEYFFMTFMEEVLEMGGVIIFVYALMAYISSEFRDLRIRIAHA